MLREQKCNLYNKIAKTKTQVYTSNILKKINRNS